MFQTNQPFGGDKKASLSLLGKWEKNFIEKNWRRFPCWIEGYHLTLTTLLWSAGLILFGFLSQFSAHWLWLSSLMIFLQWFTDSFDGALGRNRDTGIPRWGYYMDHFLDYVFLCSVLIGYSFMFNDKFNSLFYILAIFGGFMVNAYLSFAATNEFKIEHLKIGPTEVRIVFIIINTLLIIFQKTYLVSLLPFVLVFAVFSLCYVVYETQKYIWKIDMDKKRNMPTISSDYAHKNP